MQKIIKLPDIGFCYGVKRSIQLATQIANNPDIPRPIYLLGNLVHNRHITTYLTSIGIITLEKGTRLLWYPHNKSEALCRLQYC